MEPYAPEDDFLAFREQGDVGALARVFERIAPELLRAATALAGDPVLGEDLLQATFVTAIERRERWDAARPLVPWLVGILTRHGRAARRDAARRPSPERLSERVVVDPRAALEAEELVRRLDGSADDLPEPLRQVVVLFLRHDLAPAEIAEALGRSPSTVRSQLQRGLERLRARLPRNVAPALVVLPRGLGEVERQVLERARTSVPAAEPSPIAPATPTVSMLKLSALAVALTGAAALLFPPPASDPVPVVARPATSGPLATLEPIDSVVAPRRSSTAPTASTTPQADSADGSRNGAGDDESGRDARPSTFVLGVRVVDPAGAPIAGAFVDLEGVRLTEEPGSIYGWRAGTVAPGETDADGLTHLVVPASWNDMTPEAISFTVDHREFVPFCSELVPLVEGRTTVELEWGASLTVRGWIGSLEDGVVRSVAPELGVSSGAPPSDWYELGDGRVATDGLASGAHSLVLAYTTDDGRRFRSAITSVELDPGGRHEVALELFPVARVRGVLSAEVPRPVVSGELIAHQSGGSERIYARDWRLPVAEDGSFVIDDVGPGAIEVAVLADGWTSVDFEVLTDPRVGSTVEGCRNPAVEVAGADVSMTVAMVPTAEVRLALTGPGGVVVDEARLSVLNTVHWRSRRWQYFDRSCWAVTDEAGTGVLRDVRPGPQPLTVFHPEFRIEGRNPMLSSSELPGGPLTAGERREVTVELVERPEGAQMVGW